jgi:hypothetical protein
MLLVLRYFLGVAQGICGSRLECHRVLPLENRRVPHRLELRRYSFGLLGNGPNDTEL